MKIHHTFRIALRALKRNKMRSSLTMLGIIIGISSVITMVSIGNGAKKKIQEQIASLGQNMILVFSGTTTSSGVRIGYGSSGTLTDLDGQAIQREIPDAKAVSPEVRTSSQVAFGNKNWMTQILGESETYLEMREWPLQEGVFFTAQDVRTSSKTAVIGTTTARELFGTASPIGKTLRVKNVPFLVTGVLESKGFSLMGQDQDDVVIAPYTTIMKRLIGKTKVRAINVQAASAEKIPATQDQIASLLRQRHKLKRDAPDDFSIRNQEEISQMATQTANTLTVLLGSIAGISLVVGGIGIMNIMLVSVTERTREIGTRIALGAHACDILVQFLIESILLSTLGGAIGVLIGFLGSYLISKTTELPAVTATAPIVVSLVFSAAIGIIFGLYPAQKASKLNPIDALRYE